MNLWLDAQLSPALAGWLRSTFGIRANAVRDLGLREAKDHEIFQRARAEKAVIMTKDSDFIVLLDRFGVPPQIVWITCGNTSNAHLKLILERAFPAAQNLLNGGEPLVEIGDSY